MPVTHEGRYVHASPEELNRWLGRESAGEPVQIASENANLSADAGFRMLGSTARFMNTSDWGSRCFLNAGPELRDRSA